MLIGIDHIVIAVEEPDAAAAAIEAELGLTAEGGGRHDALGTFNRLVWLGDSYLELIGIFDRELAARSWIGRPVMDSLDAGGGLATWAIAVDDLDSQLRWLPADAGIVGPLDGERRRPDGRVVRWRLAHSPAISPASPFLIEHDATGAEWTRSEREARAAESHPIGGPVRLAALELETAAPAAAAASLRRLLATSAARDGRAAVKVPLGEQAVRFVSPPPAGGVQRVVHLVADASFRRRSMRIGDCEIRVRPAPRPAPGEGEAEEGAVRGD